MSDAPAPEAAVEIVLADDHAVVRSALRALLEAEPDMRIVAEAADAETALRETEAHAPHVLLLDLNMPGKSSLEAIAELAASSSTTRVVVLTMENQSALAREALAAGALGYVLKQAAEREVVDAVRAAARGELYVQAEIESRLDLSDTAPAGDLTERGPGPDRPGAHERRDRRQAGAERSNGRIPPGPYPAEAARGQPPGAGALRARPGPAAARRLTRGSSAAGARSVADPVPAVAIPQA
jgi:DNA-binding NarL/FixJ family response regulator